jgi:putative addiction module component (TIGR02574 family)
MVAGYACGMTTGKGDLLAEALNLTAAERLSLATELLDSVEGVEDPAWEAAWLAELDRRTDAADRDPDSLSDWADVKRAALDEIRRR